MKTAKKSSETLPRAHNKDAYKKNHTAKALKRPSFNNWCGKKVKRGLSRANTSELDKPLTQKDDNVYEIEHYKLNEDLKDVLTEREIRDSIAKSPLTKANKVKSLHATPQLCELHRETFEGKMSSLKAKKHKIKESIKKSKKRFEVHKRVGEAKSEMSFERLSGQLEVLTKDIARYNRIPLSNKSLDIQKLIECFNIIKKLKRMLNNFNNKPSRSFDSDFITKKMAIEALKKEVAHLSQNHQSEIELLKDKLKSKLKKEKDKCELDSNTKIKEFTLKHRKEIEVAVKNKKALMAISKPIEINIQPKYKLTNLKQDFQSNTNEQKIHELNKNINEWKDKYNEIVKLNKKLESTIEELNKNERTLKNQLAKNDIRLLKTEHKLKSMKKRFYNIDNEYKEIVERLSGKNIKEVIELEKEIIGLKSELEVTKRKSAKESSNLKLKYEKSLTKKSKKAKTRHSTMQRNKRASPSYKSNAPLS